MGSLARRSMWENRGFSQFCRRPTIWAAVFVGAFFILWVVFANPTKLATARKGDANFVGKQKIRQKWPTEPTNTLSVSIPYFVGGRQSWEMSPPILSAGRQNRGFDKTAKTPYYWVGLLGCDFFSLPKDTKDTASGISPTTVRWQCEGGHLPPPATRPQMPRRPPLPTAPLPRHPEGWAGRWMRYPEGGSGCNMVAMW